MMTLPPADCAQGTTTSIVAHEDDDLLFCSLDIMHDVRAGRCVTTIYVTAGDANRGPSYWQSRETGVKAAYAEIAGVRNTWTVADAGLPGHPVPVLTLARLPRISLAFMRLPDGFPSGSGGSLHSYESLQKLWLRQISAIHPVDGRLSTVARTSSRAWPRSWARREPIASTLSTMSERSGTATTATTTPAPTSPAQHTGSTPHHTSSSDIGATESRDDPRM